MKKITQMSDAGIKFLIREEGLITHPYKDAAGIATIGVGMTFYPNTGRKVQLTDPAISHEQATSYFRKMLQSFEAGVASLTTANINQNQFDALTSFTYNVGLAAFRKSSLLKKLNADPNDPAIEQAFLAYRNATISGLKKPVLLGRRKREADLYFSAKHL